MRTFGPLTLTALTLFASSALAGGWGWGGNNDGGNPPPNNGNPPPPPNNGWNPPPPPPNNGWQPPYPPPKSNPVQIHPNGNWRKCLDVRGAVYANGTPVDIFDCNGSGAQNWILNPGATKVQVAGQNFCLDAGEWPGNGAQLKIWTCYDNLPAQNWYYTDDKRLALRDRGLCLDLTNGDTCSGTVMQVWQCLNYDVNQIWNY